MKQFSKIKENYPQIALERFDNANLWIKYIILQIKKYLKDNIVEVGAGCGSFTSSYMNNSKMYCSWTRMTRILNHLRKNLMKIRILKLKNQT